MTVEELLAAWVQDVRSEPVPELVDTTTAIDIIRKVTP